MSESKPKVLFLCTGNSCRSQMAEGLLRHLGGDRFKAASAGTRPVALNPGAVAAMREIGIDISRHTSKHVDSLAGENIQQVITVCDHARETCPIFPAEVETLHWSFDDPADATASEEERMAVFRRVRDEIRVRIQKFLDDSAARAD